MLAPFGCVDCELRFFLGLDGSQDLARILGLDERNHMPGVLRSETRVNWFGGPQKLRAPNGIREPVRVVEPLLSVRRVMRQQFAVLHKMLLDMVRDDLVCRRLMTARGSARWSR